MQTLKTSLLIALLSTCSATASGGLQLVPATEPVHVLAGASRTLTVTWHNSGNSAVAAEVRLQLLQATSSTAAAFVEQPWKKLQVLGGQTILEQATVDIPAIEAETLFLIRWLEGTNHLLGITEVQAYPTNLLADLKPLVGKDQRVGVFDPNNALKPILKAHGVEFEDMQETGIARFHGQLTIVGPFTSGTQMADDFTQRLEQVALRGAAVVWLQPPPDAHAKLQPSFQTVRVGPGAVVLVQSPLTANLASDPKAQINLLHFCRLALKPESPRLPTRILNQVEP
jgi:hypothetical protein